MDVNQILADLRAERDRIDDAISALEALNHNEAPSVKRSYTRRKPHPLANTAPAKKSGKKRKGKKWSPEQRAKFMRTMGYDKKKPQLAKAA